MQTVFQNEAATSCCSTVVGSALSAYMLPVPWLPGLQNAHTWLNHLDRLSILMALNIMHHQTFPSFLQAGRSSGMRLHLTRSLGANLVEGRAPSG